MQWVKSGIKNASKSEVIGRRGGDEKNWMTTQNRQKIVFLFFPAAYPYYPCTEYGMYTLFICLFVLHTQIISVHQFMYEYFYVWSMNVYYNGLCNSNNYITKLACLFIM